MPYSVLYREELIHTITGNEVDVLIVGGGITGAGIALDAVSRGFSVALIEKTDFASGTSSKSTKLIHGGLRYLKNLELKLVRDTGLERAVAFRNAPHLVRPEKMLLPLIENGTYGKRAASFGLWLYDLLAMVRRDDRRVMLSKKRALSVEPLLRNDVVTGAGYYAEYRTDDARLTIEVLKTAAQRGAVAVNYVACEELIYDEGRVVGVKAKDVLSNQNITIKSKYVVNATGPWADQLREKDNSLKHKRLHLTKGVHIVVEKDKFPLNQSVYFDVDDGRMIFAIPRLGVTYIGTTDTFYEGEINAPDVRLADVKYLLQAVNAMFPSVQLVVKDVISSWSGLRPLIHEEGKSPSEISRTDEMFVSTSGLISITGGKLTGYRLMAKKVVRHICDKQKVTRKCRTRRIRLVGANFKRAREVNDFFRKTAVFLKKSNIPIAKTNYLVTTYGTQTEEIVAIYKEKNYKYLASAEAQFSIQKEGACTLEDFFVRRTGKLFFEPDAIPVEINEVCKVFIQLLHWEDGKVKLETEKLLNLLKKATDFK
ncbi:MAG: glycerol-3-phosphate dehydrogenase/oxidase [Cyclobacteriaceae bacterium]|nr:glycerol-3-phosphate dehydrogenase/oxidase [Cyclobacteriaceae bacterium]